MGERHLRRIVGGTTDGVILVGIDRSVAWTNAPALAMHGVADVAELGSDVTDCRRRFELRCRNRHKLPEGQYPMERVMAGETFDEVAVEVAPAGAISGVEGRSAGSRAGRPAMSRERIGTVARAARGALKEALGRVTGPRELEAECAAGKAAAPGVRARG